MNVNSIRTAVRESLLTSAVTCNQEFVDICLEWAVAVTEVDDDTYEVELWHWTDGESVYLTLTGCHTIKEVVDGATNLIDSEFNTVQLAA